MSCQLAPLALVRACYHTQSDQLHVKCGLADSFNAAEAVGTGSATLAELPPPHRRRSFRLAGEGSVCLAAPPLPPRSVLQGHRSRRSCVLVSRARSRARSSHPWSARVWCVCSLLCHYSHERSGSYWKFAGSIGQGTLS